VYPRFLYDSPIMFWLINEGSKLHFNCQSSNSTIRFVVQAVQQIHILTILPKLCFLLGLRLYFFASATKVIKLVADTADIAKRTQWSSVILLQLINLLKSSQLLTRPSRLANPQ